MSPRPRLATAFLALAAGCATAPPATAPPAKSDPPLDPSVKVAIAETTPSRGGKIEAGTTLQVVAEYSLSKVEVGRDRVTVFFRTERGGTIEPTHYLLSKAEGRVTFKLSGAALLRSGVVGRPLRMHLELGRWETPARTRTLARSEEVTFQADESVPRDVAKFLPPSVGKAQMISDMVGDPRYKPRLPPELKVSGVWGLFKLCVDPEGQVYDVQVIKSAHRLVDDEWVAVMRTVEHRPYLINGKPIFYCYPVRLEVRR
jgi:hypothetical protein